VEAVWWVWTAAAAGMVASSRPVRTDEAEKKRIGCATS
jgi:hypothetical protein